jgi:hypothetical protein
MMKCKIKIEPEALVAIHIITNWYSEAQPGLGESFRKH